MRPHDPGACRVNETAPEAPGWRYAYDDSLGECIKFWSVSVKTPLSLKSLRYTGCAGSVNRFHTRHQCNAKCAPLEKLLSRNEVRKSLAVIEFAMK